MLTHQISWQWREIIYSFCRGLGNQLSTTNYVTNILLQFISLFLKLCPALQTETRHSSSLSKARWVYLLLMNSWIKICFPKLFSLEFQASLYAKRNFCSTYRKTDDFVASLRAIWMQVEHVRAPVNANYNQLCLHRPVTGLNRLRELFFPLKEKGFISRLILMTFTTVRQPPKDH